MLSNIFSPYDVRMNIDDKQGWLDNIAAARRRRYAGPRGVPAEAAPAAVC